MRRQLTLAMSLAIILSGCMADQMLYGMGKAYEIRIGFRSAPTTVPKVGGVPIALLPLNNNYYRSSQAFVVCFIGPADSNLVHREISLDLSNVVLALPDGRRLHPQAYGENGVCPRSDYFVPIDDIFTFSSAMSGAKAKSLRRSPTARVFSDIAFRFDVKPIDPQETFSIELSSVDIDGRSYVVPSIDFSRVYGYADRSETRRTMGLD